MSSAKLTTEMTLTKATDGLRLFSDSDGSQPSKVRLYGLQIYESGVPVRNYIPYRDRKVVGLYDTLTKEFIPCEGATTGGDVRRKTYGLMLMVR